MDPETRDEEIVTIDELEAASMTVVRLPVLSRARGRDVKVRITRLARPDYLSFLPPPPPGAWEWPPKEAIQRELAWLETLTPEARAERVAAVREVKYRVCAAATLQPAMTVERARRLGDDAVTLAYEILAFSGLLDPPATAGAAEDAAAPPMAAPTAPDAA